MMRAFFSRTIRYFAFTFAFAGMAFAEALPLTTKLHRNIPAQLLLSQPPPPATPPSEPAQRAPAQLPAGIRHLAATSSGAPRFDMLEFLVAQGVTRRAGQAAIYLPNESALVFTGAAEDQHLVERMFEMACVGFGTTIKSVELSISAWTYLDEPAALVKNQARSFEEIQAIAGDTLRPLDSHLIVTRSGNRAPSIHVLATEDGPPKAAGPGELPPLKTAGSVVAIEPVIGPDGSTVDFQMEYHARIPQPGLADVCFSIHTNATIADGKNLILQNLLFPPLENQDAAKVRRCAVIAGVRVLVVPDQESQMSAEEKKARDEKVIAEALEGLPPRGP